MEESVARLLNLPLEKRLNLSHFIEDYFVSSRENDSECSSDEEECFVGSEDEDDVVSPVTTEADASVNNEVSVHGAEGKAEDENNNTVKELDTEPETVEPEDELVICENFSCGCTKGRLDVPGSKKKVKGPCSKLLAPIFFLQSRLDMTEIEPKQRDLFILGMIACGNRSTETIACSKRKVQKPRKRHRTIFWIHQTAVCKKTFEFAYNIGKKYLDAMIDHYVENGLTPRERKSGGRACNTKRLSFEDAQKTKTFITNYANTHALVLPGRVAGHKDSGVQSPPCSKQISMHYSFDFAQQVHLPSNPLQPGPIYFLVPRKCGLFGVCCEGLPRQVNFLIDEAHSISKGSNSVISYLHYFFWSYGLGETDVHLHCDNCSGQNKNKFMLWYLAWRVAIGLHKTISLNFLVAGHTKFAPDWCFGLVKQTFRRHAVSSLSCMESVVNGSACCNQAQLVGMEDGTSIVPVMDWQKHLGNYGRPLKGIKKMHHFKFDSATPGVVLFRENSDAEWASFNIFNSLDLPQRDPKPIPPPGLDRKRIEYLYHSIRPYVPEEFKDIVCPPPAGLNKRPTTNDNDDEDEDRPRKMR
ncbi:hypothetical protein CAPTEDRAFT_189695 [Capitella teleta]|uniref:DUF7869 domain-containing protein n=1 Tax=Capitella teleta TaxID=283909 RepID=R7TAY7_CAPTE|nr:hypothetical protein CAPTEDRAFT_189695 [Capitella teleta]|eukprot:ELT90677.1 hypothetical protein CAPTEDRAFT_189695 [Capitella teleta]